MAGQSTRSTSRRRARAAAPVERVARHAGKGLEGNRYYFEDGAEAGSRDHADRAEAIEGWPPSTASRSPAAESRRNVLTQGIDLNALVGKRFRVGDVECVGVELCQPCTTLEG